HVTGVQTCARPIYDHVVGLEPYSADPVERDGVEGDPERLFEEEPVRAERGRRDAVAGHDGDPGHLEAIRVVAPEVAPLVGEPRPDGGGDEVEAARLDETAELRVPGSWEEDGPGRPLAPFHPELPVQDPCAPAFGQEPDESRPGG